MRDKRGEASPSGQHEAEFPYSVNQWIAKSRRPSATRILFISAEENRDCAYNTRVYASNAYRTVFISWLIGFNLWGWLMIRNIHLWMWNILRKNHSLFGEFAYGWDLIQAYVLELWISQKKKYNWLWVIVESTKFHCPKWDLNSLPSAWEASTLSCLSIHQEYQI